MDKIYEFEKQLVGKRVSVRAYNRDDRFTGVLLQYYREFYVLRLDEGETKHIMRRVSGPITPIEDNDKGE